MPLRWRQLLLLLTLALAGATAAATAGGVRAQVGAEAAWSEPVSIFSTLEGSEFPGIVTDPSGTVHALWREDVRDRNVLAYARLRAGRWSNPTDVLITPGNLPIDTPTLAVDGRNWLHALWQSGGRIYHSTVFAAAADSSQQWRAPLALATLQGRLAEPHLVIDADDVLHVVMLQTETGKGIYYSQSADSGLTWSTPRPIHLAARQSAPAHPRLAAGADGRLHAVWLEGTVGDSAAPRQVRYANSADGGRTWSSPQTVATGDYDWPGIAERAGDDLHVVWSGSGDNWGVYDRRSADGGSTWEPVWFSDIFGGHHGRAALVADGGNALHRLQIATPNRVRDTQVVIHLVWDDNAWSEPQFTARMAPIGNLTARHLSAAVNLGNQLHVLYERPASVEQVGGQFDIYHSARTLPDAPPLAPQPLVAPTPVVTVAPTAEPTAVPPTPTPVPVFTTPIARPTSQWTPIVIGVGSLSAVLLVIAVGYGLVRRR